MRRASASIVRRAASVASPAPIGSTTKLMPSTMEPRGNQFPNQYTVAPWLERTSKVAVMPRVMAATAVARPSAAAAIEYLAQSGQGRGPDKRNGDGKGREHGWVLHALPSQRPQVSRGDAA